MYPQEDYFKPGHSIRGYPVEDLIAEDLIAGYPICCRKIFHLFARSFKFDIFFCLSGYVPIKCSMAERLKTYHQICRQTVVAEVFRIGLLLFRPPVLSSASSPLTCESISCQRPRFPTLASSDKKQ